MQNTSPNVGCHRVDEPLSFSRVGKRNPDGTFKNRSINGIQTLCSVPGTRGISHFYGSDLESLNLMHMIGGNDNFGCLVNPLNHPLPEGLVFVQGHPFTVPIIQEGSNEYGRITLGHHYSLMVTRDIPVPELIAKYDEVKRSYLISDISAVASASKLRVDEELLPDDRLVCAIFMALEKLSETSDSPNVRILSWLYANHLRAQNMSFEEFLKLHNIVDMAIIALDGYVAVDARGFINASEAQEKLASEICEEIAPKLVSFKPYWELEAAEALMQGEVA